MMTLYTATITLILVMDPLGNIPVFLSILKSYELKRQVQIIIREVFIAFLILTLFLFFGSRIMTGLNITTAALSIAGAIILFLIALKMIFPSEKVDEESAPTEEPLIVPLAIPLTSGPSAIAIVMLFATRQPDNMHLLFSAITISSIIYLAIMLLAHRLMRILGNRGLIAIERLMGMILTTIAVQMFLSGLIAYLH